MQQYKAISIRIKDKATDTMHAVEHDHRLYAEAKNIPKYIDTAKTHMNRVLFQHPEYPVPRERDKTKIREYIQKIEEKNREDFQKLKSEGKIPRNQGYQIKRPVLSGILTLSHEAKKELEANQRKMEEFLAYAKSYLLQLAGALGTDLLYAVLHMDETSPHIHFAMRNIRVREGKWTDEKALGKSLSSTFYSMRSVRAKNGKSYQIEYTKLQDSLSFFNKIGFGRGIPRVEREMKGEPMHTYIHRSVRQLHADLPKEISEKEETIAKLNDEIRLKQQELQKITLQKQQELTKLNNEIGLKQQELTKLNDEIRLKQQELQKIDSQWWQKHQEIIDASLKLKEVKKELTIVEEQLNLTKEQREKNRQEAIMRIKKRLAQNETEQTEQKSKDKDKNIQNTQTDSFIIEP